MQGSGQAAPFGIGGATFFVWGAGFWTDGAVVAAEAPTDGPTAAWADPWVRLWCS
jgi:hypothetical protein